MNNDPPLAHPVDVVLARLRRRQRMLQCLRMTVRGALLGGVLAVAAALWGALEQAEWLQQSPRILAWCLALTAGLGAVAGLLQPVDSLRVARALDGAAASQDRFASALQLADHHRRQRARLVIEDALAAVRNVAPASALPLRAPAELRLLPLPAIALALIFWLAPHPVSDASPPDEPEIAPDQWAQLHDEFQKELRELPEPRNPEERELTERLRRLAEKLAQNPDKKEVLEQIARLRTELEKRQQSLPGRNLSARRAAASVRSGSPLKPFASRMQQGQYKQAAQSLRELAGRLRKNAQAFSAEDFESVAADLDRMADDLTSPADLGHACKNCANAAGSMNEQKFSDALDRLAKELEKNAEDLEESDRLCRACNMLDELKDRLNQCRNRSQCKDGQCSKPGCGTCDGFVQRSNKKGGTRAGWGTATNWQGGQRTADKEQRLPTLAAAREQPGRSTSYRVVSRDERADSALEYKDVYADFVRKAEADLLLESVPLSHREYLRRYFMSIRPRDDAAAEPEAHRE